MSERVFVSELKVGEHVEQVFAVRDRILRERRDGIPFLKLRLADKTGEVDGVLWEDALGANARIVNQEFVQVKGRVERYQRSNSINISRIEAVPPEGVNTRFFLPETPRSRKELWRRMEELLKGVQNRHLSALLTAFFGDEAFATVFREAPAAKRFHHAYLGGLLEHSVAVATMAEKVAEQYPELDRDLLLAGAILHDVGKIREYKFRTSIDYTDEGRLLGHIVIGDRMVAGKIAGIPDFPEELAQKFRHLLLAHHGEMEYGSPVSIRIPEAFALHFLDNLDAKLNTVKSVIEHAGETGTHWTPYDRRLGREFFLGERDKGPPTLF
ncbi:MAG: HD domain-containing protein [Candidatus Eisenbacteria sp.]|nr:HD domain-containing protein [Candidatus Eisenbacteria bacterium]